MSTTASILLTSLGLPQDALGLSAAQGKSAHEKTNGSLADPTAFV